VPVEALSARADGFCKVRNDDGGSRYLLKCRRFPDKNVSSGQDTDDLRATDKVRTGGRSGYVGLNGVSLEKVTRRESRKEEVTQERMRKGRRER
jgi:hypothetical protein